MLTPVLLAMVAFLVNQLRYSIIEIVEFQRKDKDSSTKLQDCCACLRLFTVRICGILLVILAVFFICGRHFWKSVFFFKIIRMIRKCV